MSHHETIQTIRDTIYDTIQVFDTTSFINLSASKLNLNLFLTAGIAFVAVIVSSLTLYFSYKNNKLQIEPFLSIKLRLTLGDKLGFSIKNVGLGPAKIDYFEYYSRKGIKKAIKNVNFGILFQEKPFTDKLLTIYGISAGAQIAPGEHVDLLSFSEVTNDINDLISLRDFIKDTNFKIHYKTAYGEKRYTKSSKVLLKQILPGEHDI